MPYTAPWAFSVFLALHSLGPAGALVLRGGDDMWGSTGTLPVRGRVAVMIRGQTFRAKPNLASCNEDVHGKQFNATRSMLKHIIQPLELHGNRVDIFVQESPPVTKLPAECSKPPPFWENLFRQTPKPPDPACVDRDSTCRDQSNKELFELFLPRNVTMKRFLAGAQGDGMRKFMNFVIEAGGGVDRIGSYDLVIVTRHDIIWEQPIEAWSANFSKLNFASPCEREGPCRCAHSPRTCVHDMLHTMPGKSFAKFDREVGRDMCFCFKDCKQTAPGILFVPQSGHGCWDQMARVFGETNLGFASDWVPRFLLREKNHFANMC